MTTSITVEVIPCASLGMVKCPRCLHWSYSIGFDNLCNRCVAIILKFHPESPQAAEILKNLEERNLSPDDNPALNPDGTIRGIEMAAP